jgi:hypothetical protein
MLTIAGRSSFIMHNYRIHLKLIRLIKGSFELKPQKKLPIQH